MSAASESVGRLISPALQLLALADLKLSDSEAQVERRAHFDKAALKELAASIDAQGMLQPIVVRALELPGGRVNHVVVAGERRYLAAQIAGWAQVPCNVRKGMTDADVIEVQVVENLQREDLHELAEAEAYEALSEIGLTAEQIAAKVGREATYVLRRLRLKTLGKAARRAFYDGVIGFSLAVELAKLPVHAHQEEVLKWIVEERNYEEVTQASVARHIAEQFLTDLKKAPFPIAMASLVPKAGDCMSCPKRTAAQGALFEQVKGLGHCLDLVCFNAKKLAHSSNLLAEAKDRGQKVLKNQAEVPDNYVRLDHQQSHGGKSLKQLLDKDYQPVLVQLKTGEVVPVAPAADAKKVLPKEKAPERDRGMDDYRRRQRAEEKKTALENSYRRAVLTELADKPFFTSDAGRLADLRLATDQMANRLSHDTKKALFKAMGWEPIEKKSQYRGKWLDYNSALEKILKGYETESELWQLLRILTVADDLVVYNNQGPPDRKDRLHQLAERLGVAWKLILKELTDAAAAKEKPKKKAVHK